jgi:ATP-binding cassette subfamily F protein 3
MGANVTLGYYSQEHEDIGLRDNVIDEIRYSSNLDDPQIRNLLARFGFRGEDVFKSLDVLSGGEKSRLALCKLFLSQGNLLLLDEPTNHLDMDTRELLEEALQEYEGTILTVSHDRYFLNRTVNKIALLTPQGLKITEGDYTTYREIMENLYSREVYDDKLNDGEIQAAKSYQEESRNNRRREKKIKLIEEQIASMEVILKDLEEKLEAVSGDYEETLRLHNEYEEREKELDDLMHEWIDINLI